MPYKLKSFLRDERLYLAGLLCVIGIVSFALGRYSAEAPPEGEKVIENKAGIVFIDAPAVVQNEAVAQTVIASRSGTKYHLPTCTGANTIKESNKIYFNSIKEAKAAGYEPAGNCEF